MTPLEKAQQALKNHTDFNGDSAEDCCVFVDGPDHVMFELAPDNGQFNLSEFRALVNEFAELKHRMDELESRQRQDVRASLTSRTSLGTPN